jgi:hypothetical protein
VDETPPLCCDRPRDAERCGLCPKRSTAINSSGSQSQSTAYVSGVRSSANTRSSSQSASVGNRSSINITTYAGVDGSGNNAAAGGAGAGGTGSGGTSGSGATGATDPSYNVNYGGGHTVRNVPEVIPPNVVGGNPCSVGASAGMSVAGFGIAGGATWADKQCERRQQAALLYNIGKQKAATELLCQDENIRAALRVSGEPCAADMAPGAAAASAPVAQATPVLAAAKIEPAPAAKPIRPEWCYTAGPAELRHHQECDVRS